MKGLSSTESNSAGRLGKSHLGPDTSDALSRHLLRREMSPNRKENRGE